MPMLEDLACAPVTFILQASIYTHIIQRMLSLDYAIPAYQTTHHQSFSFDNTTKANIAIVQNGTKRYFLLIIERWCSYN